MQTAVTIAQARALFGGLPRPSGFVPTMGALHAGHVALVSRAREQCASVAVSLFVNPAQFGPTEDLARYPRDLQGDVDKLIAAGADALFAPDAAMMYPAGFTTFVDVAAPSAGYEGAIRPQHFRGVSTVVAKLLHIVQPDVLYLGQKDAQQTVVLRRMIADLAFGLRVEIVPTVRESDGLAMSSRNAYLTPGEREQAPTFHRALLAMREALRRGAAKAEAIAAARGALSPQAKADYFDLVDADTFEPLERLRAPAFVIGAVRLGKTRLLDNLYVAADGQREPA